MNTYLFIVFGVVIGLGVYAFIYAKGYSYMSSDPANCANCHAMRENLDSWSKSTHHHVAKCNDCHLPHNPVAKLAVKALHGFNHSMAFTLQNYKDPIQIKEHSLNVVKGSCLNCHQSISQNAIHDVDHKSENLNCLTCHRSVGHAK